MTKLPEGYPNDVIGEPSVPTSVRYCSTCATNVVPVGKGQCPKCGQFLTWNTGHKLTVNVKRREHYHAENIAEYRPDTLQLRDACRLLANVRERLDTTREGTPEHQRLIAAWTELTATLEASRTSRQASTTANLEQLSPDQLVEKAERLLELARAARGDSGVRPASGPGSEAPDANFGSLGAPTSDASGPAGARLSTESGAVLDERCQYCHQSPCVGPSHHAYDVLHYEDPEHVEARRQKATAEMYESFRRARKGGDPNVR